MLIDRKSGDVMTKKRKGLIDKEISDAVSRLTLASTLMKDATVDIIGLAIKIKDLAHHFPDDPHRSGMDMLLAHIMEKCAFEDLASQHITKVTTLLSHVMGEIPAVIIKGDAEPSLLGGSQVNTEDSLSQEAINALLGEGDDSFSPPVPSGPIGTLGQMAAFSKAVQLRKNRKQPEILIVDNQPFSCRLLDAMVEDNYKTYIASNAEEAFELYIVNAPDITFLDMETYGKAGHELAETIKQIDTEAFIVMVASNSDKEDMITATRNSAVGFVVKPFGKEKITTYIDQYKSSRKR